MMLFSFSFDWISPIIAAIFGILEGGSDSNSVFGFCGFWEFGKGQGCGVLIQMGKRNNSLIGHVSNRLSEGSWSRPFSLLQDL